MANSIMVSSVAGVGDVEIDGQRVMNVERITIDASKEYVTAQVSYVPSDVFLHIEGTRLVCENCGAGLVVAPGGAPR